MSKIVDITIDSISNGQSSLDYLFGKGQYLSAIGIDPEMPVTDTAIRPSGVIRPTSYEKFSSTELTSHPVAIITTPKTTKIYVVLANGKLIQYDSDYTNPTELADIGLANGAVYYNDYIYIPTSDNVSRWGPLSGSASITNNYWRGTLSKTALINSTYPTIHGTGTYPNHVIKQHEDTLYMLDYNTQGMVHIIRTGATGTDDGSTYNALDLPFGYYPTDVASFGADIGILAIPSTDSTINKGKSILFLWDTDADSWYRTLEIPGIATALYNLNGLLIAFSGSISGNGGYSLYGYDGSLSMVPIATVPSGFPPLSGAVESVGNRLYWGTNTNDPENASVLMAYGSKDGIFKGINCIGRSTLTTSATDGMVTAIKHALQGTYAKPTILIGGKNQTAFEYFMEKPSTTYVANANIWRSQRFNLSDFTIKEVKLPLGGAISANMGITATLYIDDGSKTSVLKTINSTNFPNSERAVTLYPSTNAEGDCNFFLELKWTGTALLSVSLPIEVIIEQHD